MTIRVVRQRAMQLDKITFHYKNKKQGQKTMFVHVNHEEIIYP